MTDPIKVWRYENAPEEYRRLSPHGGDEDWVALVPWPMANEWIGWLEPGTTFGCCDVSSHDHADGRVYIGAHA